NAHDLTIIIDRRGGSRGVAGDQREFVDLVVWRSQSPHGWEKLENLVAWLVLAATRVVMNASLRPANRLTQVIGSGGKTIVSTRKIGKRPHLVVFPNEPEVDIAYVVRRTVESRATPVLDRLRRKSLGNTHEDARGIFHVPCDTAVWSAQCAEIREQTVSPQCSVPIPVRQSGIACHPALVVNAVSPATSSSEAGKIRHLVMPFCFCLRLFRSLCKRGRQGRSATGSDQYDGESFASSFDRYLCCHVCLLC